MGYCTEKSQKKNSKTKQKHEFDNHVLGGTPEIHKGGCSGWQRVVQKQHKVRRVVLRRRVERTPRPKWGTRLENGHVTSLVLVGRRPGATGGTEKASEKSGRGDVNLVTYF